MKQRLFKQGDCIPQWLLKHESLSNNSSCMFGVDVEIVINKHRYLVFPLQELKENEYMVIVEYNRLLNNKKCLCIYTKQKFKYKKHEKRYIHKENHFMLNK